MSIKITFYIQPGAKKSIFAGFFNNIPKIKVSSPPVDGAANKELVKFLAKKLKISKSDIKILSGEKSRTKVIEIDGFNSLDEILGKLKG